jgi:hypothetical protein
MAVALLTAAVLALITAVSVATYLLPVLIGWARHVPDLGSVAVIDVLLGWTLVGWVVALALALRSVTPGGPVVQFVQTLPPYFPPAAELSAPADWAGPPGPPPPRPDCPPPLVLPPHPVGWWDPAGEG